MIVPAARVTAANDAPVRPARAYVLYWMTAYRRLKSNFALQHAAACARELRRPLLVVEALACDYPWASERLHAFVIDGMVENLRTAQAAGVRALAYVETERGAGRGLLRALARRAALVVADDFPAFIQPALLRAAARSLDVRLQAVDAAGLIPFRAAGRAFPTAAVFRRHVQRVLPGALSDAPLDDPLRAAAPAGMAAVDPRVLARWPMLDASFDAPRALSRLPIAHDVAPVRGRRGGRAAALARLASFVGAPLDRYADRRSTVSEAATSGLSPYLHFGHLGAHEVLGAATAAHGWSLDRLGPPNGARAGFWNLPPGPEAFLDQLVVWRELGLAFCAHHASYDRLGALPAWARATLDAHARDRRPWTYTLSDLERGRTHDEVWNAAQRELVDRGGMNGYLRMLWGKKVIEWTPTPALALSHLIHLNNRYALDGRDPNSYTGILWCLGAFDRPWAPERPVFGRVRYMSSANARRKLRLGDYLRRFAPTPAPAAQLELR